jgi:predicted acetyltransferase
MNGSNQSIRLLKPTREFSDEFLSLLEEHQDAGENLPNAELARTDFAAYVRHLHAWSHSRDLPAGYVPVTTFWLVKENTMVLGDSQLRHTLTPELEAYWGHISYRIRPAQRRKGYGTLLLKLTLEQARILNIQRVRVICDQDNIGSARIIERNGGMLSGYGVDSRNGKHTLQYWIEL